MPRLLLLLAVLALAGCAGKPGVDRAETFVPRKGSVIPNTSLKLTPSITMPLEKIINWGLYAGVAYLVLDPLAPNWQIEETPLGEEHIHFSLKMKRYYSGGAGEARAVFHRRAKELTLLNEFEAYQVVEYNEGMQSSLLGAQRTAEGVVKLVRKAG